MVKPFARRALSLVPVLALLLIAGCGGDGGEGSTVNGEPAGDGRTPQRTEVAKIYDRPRPGIPADPGQWMVDVGVDPDGDLGFTVAKVIAPPGNTNFRLLNPTATNHDLTIREVGAGSISTEPVHEGTEWVRSSLFEGKRYVFYCSLPGHRKAGMVGVIEVDPQLEGSELRSF